MNFALAQAKLDSLFRQAQKLAYSGNYQGSRELCKRILKESPDFYDASILMGSTFAWQQQYDSARHVLVPLLEKESVPVDAFVVLANVELWSGSYTPSLHYADKGLKNHPGATPLLLSKARALRDLNELNNAKDVLSDILEIDPEHEESLKMLNQLKEKSKKNGIHVNFQRNTFDINMAPWLLGFVEYSRATTKVKYIARLNYGEQNERQSLQAEVDVYPQLGKKSYAYLNLGVSDNKLFPSYRTGLEVYHLLPYKIEVAIGVRSLSFPENNVFLYTGQIGKYISKTMITFRSFLQNKDDKMDFTGIFQIRQYLKHDDEFVSLMAGKGTMPFIQVGSQEIFRLNAKRISLEGQFRFLKTHLIGGMLAYEHEEYNYNAFRNRFTTGISFKTKF